MAGFPDPPLQEVDPRVMKACLESILFCLRLIHVIAQADIKGYIDLSETDRFIIRVSLSRHPDRAAIRPFLRAIAKCLARVLAMACRASVHLSVTLLYCIKTVQAMITKFSPAFKVYRNR